MWDNKKRLIVCFGGLPGREGEKEKNRAEKIFEVTMSEKSKNERTVDRGSQEKIKNDKYKAKQNPHM